MQGPVIWFLLWTLMKYWNKYMRTKPLNSGIYVNCPHLQQFTWAVTHPHSMPDLGLIRSLWHKKRGSVRKDGILPPSPKCRFILLTLHETTKTHSLIGLEWDSRAALHHSGWLTSGNFCWKNIFVFVLPPSFSHTCLLWRGDFEGVKFPSKGERPRNRTLQSAGHLPLSWWSWCFEIYASSSPQVGNNFLLYRKAAALWRDVEIHFDCQTSEGRTALFQEGNTFVKCSCAWSRATGAIVDFLLSAVKPHGYLRANTIP